MNKKRLLVILFFFNFLPAYSVELIHKYTISISNDLSTLNIKVQFADIDFYYLYAGSKSAAQHTKNMYFSSDKTEILTPQSEELALMQNAANKIMFYEFDMPSSLGKGRWSAAKQVGNDVIVPPDLWLWRPYSLQKNEHIEVSFDFPDNINYSVPWTPVGENLYRIPSTPLDWPAAAAFGSFNKEMIQVENCRFTLAFMDGNYKTTQSQLIDWIRGTAESVCNVYGEFPLDNVQILIIPGEPRSEPVPFGMVIRGGGLTINFYIDPSRPLQEFIADWTATHELSHCLMPFIRRGDAWLSEGLATYYQYILMGRDGRLNEQQTWQRIYNGFQKGIRGSKGETLKTTANKMYEFRAFRNVYWSGAAMLLKADVALRKHSAGQKSLDSVLKKIKQNILPKNKSWNGLEMINVMDKLANTTIFMDIYNKYIYSKEFPVDDAYWAELGVIIKNGEVYIDNDAPLADIRKNLLEK